MRIQWQNLFDKGVTPKNIKDDRVTYSWYTPKQDPIMYRAYRNWKAKKKTSLQEKIEESIEVLPTDAPTPTVIAAATEFALKDLAMEIAAANMKIELQKSELLKKVLESIDTDTLSEVLQIRLIEALSKR